MPPSARRWLLLCTIAAIFVLAIYPFTELRAGPSSNPLGHDVKSSYVAGDRVQWKRLPQQHPLTSLRALPTGQPAELPKIQYDFSGRKESTESEVIRKQRLDTVLRTFAYTWKGYKDHAWLKDEVSPVSGKSKNTFGGWAATLVDSLDSLYIMGFRKEFTHAVNALAKVDFSRSSMESISVFETTIRYLGGFLSAYDLSGNSLLLDKAIQLGDMLYFAFDTPNRMPLSWWKWREAAESKPQVAGHALLADLGSLSLEFTRLSQLTKDPKYFDAVQRITDSFFVQQNSTKLPGMWSVTVDAGAANFTVGDHFSLGAMADSMYEYLPKQFMLLGGLHDEYRILYEAAIETAKKHILFRPLNKNNLDILISGSVKVIEGEIVLDPEGQHLACFAGGMVAIGSQIFHRKDVETARKLVDGCIWAYESTPSGIMPETFRTIPCNGTDGCTWDEKKWHKAAKNYHHYYDGSAESLIRETRLPPGFTDIADPSYGLRPEAIEAIFILYRVTGDPVLLENAWTMFQAIEKHTKTKIAHSALADITVVEPPQSDKMESFWTAETLKYFFLMFSEPDFISLDDYVFNTEAHPFKRPRRDGGQA